MFQKYNKLVILDTETTGLDKDVNEIIEFAALVLNKQKNGKFKVNEEIDFFIQYDEPIPEFITNLTHITDEMCWNGYTKERTVLKFRELFDKDEKTLVIIYNTPFDMGFIQSFMNKYSDGFVNKLDTLDLLEVAKARTGTRKGCRYYCNDGIVLDADWNAAINIMNRYKHSNSFDLPIDGKLNLIDRVCQQPNSSWCEAPRASHDIFSVVRS